MKAHVDTQMDEVLTLAELCGFCHTDNGWIVELVKHGILEPDGRSVEEWTFRAAHAARAKKAERLHRDLGINAAGIGLILDLQDERDALRRQLARMDAL
ncbi:chaperone modulator CbpM [Roseivivax sp. CAU 1753]